MKISQIIIVIIVVLIATTVLTHISIIPSREVSVLNESGEETSDTDVSVAPPEDLSSVDNVTINPPEIKPPYGADEGKVESAPAESELADESKPADESVAESAPMVSEPKVEEETKEETEEERKLTYQDVFNEETEKTPKHTFLKVLAILILLLIILEVAAILIRRFAPDSAIGLQIQQIYEMLFSRFL